MTPTHTDACLPVWWGRLASLRRSGACGVGVGGLGGVSHLMGWVLRGKLQPLMGMPL